MHYRPKLAQVDISVSTGKSKAQKRKYRVIAILIKYYPCHSEAKASIMKYFSTIKKQLNYLSQILSKQKLQADVMLCL
jgi:hypothetical protein